jgi:hypothetical protein
MKRLSVEISMGITLVYYDKLYTYSYVPRRTAFSNGFNASLHSWSINSSDTSLVRKVKHIYGMMGAQIMQRSVSQATKSSAYLMRPRKPAYINYDYTTRYVN